MDTVNPEREACSNCGGPLSTRSAARQPLGLQVAFGLSFVGFLALESTLKNHPFGTRIVWAWTALQVLLGLLLVRARMQARRRVFRCVRCGEALR